MMQWFLSSSVLILMIMALRWLLKGKISLRLQYALWALVLVRLLVPLSLPASRISVQNIAVSAPVREAAQVRLPQQSFDDAYAQVVQEYRDQGVAVESIDQSTLDTQAMERMKSEITLGQALTALWALGVAAVLGFTAWCNVRFRARLRRSWRRLELPWVSLPVYVSPELDTPCIFGSFRPVICLTPDVAEDETLLRHILEHELTHHRHGDHVLAPLRCVALALHWFNPLVWLAVGQSRRDGEMACDEGTIRRLGEGERISYGRTLIRLTCQTSRPRDYVLAATTLRGDKMTIKERIVMIAKKPTTALYALLIVVCITVFAIGCTFTAAEETEETTPQTTEETVQTEPTQTTEEIVPEEEPVDDGILLGKIEVLLGEHIRQNYGEDAAFTAKTVREMEEWFNHHLCRTDYRLTVQGQTQEGSMYTLWYEDPYAEDGTFLLQEQDFDGSMLSPEWWQERYPMGDVTWQPEEVSFYGGSNFDFVTQLSDEHELYCGHRGNVYDHYMNRMRMMFPDGDVGIFLYDNVPVDLGREEGYYVYRLEYYLGREGTIYQLRNYTVYRFRDKPVSGNVWEFFAILSDEDLRGYGIDPDTIKEAEPAPYEDHCR